MKNGVVVEAKTRKYHLRYRESLTWAARTNRKNETESEKILWNKLLRRKYLGYKFIRQKPIGRFIIDFYCSGLSLAIEVDGGSHLAKKAKTTQAVICQIETMNANPSLSLLKKIASALGTAVRVTL